MEGYWSSDSEYDFAPAAARIKKEPKSRMFKAYSQKDEANKKIKQL